MDKAKPGAKPISYWAGRKEDGLWYAYQQVPRREDFKFVFEELSKSYLKKKQGNKIQVHDFRLVDGTASAREARIRYSVAGDFFTKKLDFQKDPESGWAVAKDENIKSVY